MSIHHHSGDPKLKVLIRLNADAETARIDVHGVVTVANVRALYGDRLVYCDRPYGALEGAHGLVIVTEWQEFRNPDFGEMKRRMKSPVIFDGRNLYEPGTMKAAGIVYQGIGRNSQ